MVGGVPFSPATHAWFEASFAAAHEEPAALVAAVVALGALFQERRRRALRIARIDGVPSLDSPLRDAFLRAGFRAEYKGPALDRFATASDRV